MFQYAMGRALSIRYGIPLALDLYGFEFDKFYRRKYELEFFCIPRDIIKVNYPVKFRLCRLFRRFSESNRIITRLLWPKLLVEASGEYEKQNTRLVPKINAYIMGYWQDERYFKDCSETIRHDLELSSGFSKANKEMAGFIKSVNAVAIHVRRLHDVATRPSSVPQANAMQKGIALDVDYYNCAIAQIRARVIDPYFIVFSDFPQWARENLDLHNAGVFLEKDRGPDYEDMCLMSLCKHHIIANSSFSWWGAWLARNETKVVIAPSNVRHIPSIPENWICI